MKFPRQGRPAKKLFRFSFVEGNIYLTWKGKAGNQGVGIGEVTMVRSDVADTSVMKWTKSVGKQDHFLSVVCSDRSVDLFFETIEERNNWKVLLEALHLKEQGNLVGVDSYDSGDESSPFEMLILHSSIGKTFS